jgi:hypothetical protein
MELVVLLYRWYTVEAMKDISIVLAIQLDTRV